MTESVGRLLVVDDETPVVEVLCEYFTTQGYSVETAGNGADALAAARRRRPDLVLLDIRMPGMDGVEVLKKMREVDPSVAVIMVTANEDVALARETLKIGAFDYVAKPFDFRYLDRAVSAALVQGGSGGAPMTTADGEDLLRRLAFQIFRAVRAMPPGARESTGARLEQSALEAVREAVAGRAQAAALALADIELLAAIATDLGDLTASARSSVETALQSARKAVSHG